jgi:hypothetical protein
MQRYINLKTNDLIRKKRKKVVNSKKGVYDGIQFASQLEITMYKELKAAGIVDFKFEPRSYVTFKPFEIDTECYERATKRSKEMVSRTKVTKVSYTPDFVDDNEEWFIEVKGRANESFPIRWKLFKKMLQRDNPRAIVFKPMNLADCKQTAQILKQKGYGSKKD